ncbi:AGE family epimerase/isomerase [Jonesia quinghaiensis]|uniref:AGE family epimerase/isomerase n=1 Tax=Jonesia quinghaiensis TaxID=262806 RepID=UPI00041D21D9|nr:AGE family epimerase/isomerase [Jonesia quinghaiensis]
MTDHTGPALTSATHHSWLATEAHALLDFAQHTMVDGRGAGWLDEHGTVDPRHGIQTWITCRMVHCYAIGALMGHEGAQKIAQNGLDALISGPLRDHTNGGWNARIDADPDLYDTADDTTKSAYAHAFVVLAATSAVAAGLRGAEQLLTDALEVLDLRFFEESSGLHVDEWDASWTQLSDYRGVNANMHAVEALLAAGDVTGETRWHDRALGIARTVALSWAAPNGWRIPEHFTPAWKPLLEYNEDRKDDKFKPYGATVGHGIEWARLLLHLDALQPGEHPWLQESARSLYSRAIGDGWRRSTAGEMGFVYTTNWHGTPVVETRMHWVPAEALAAAAALFHATDAPFYAKDYEEWLGHVRRFFRDDINGSWHHELDTHNQPSGHVWPGKPDIYHAFGAMLTPLLPLTPTLASAVKAKAGQLG